LSLRFTIGQSKYKFKGVFHGEKESYQIHFKKKRAPKKAAPKAKPKKKAPAKKAAPAKPKPAAKSKPAPKPVKKAGAKERPPQKPNRFR
jgi:hypothetical protein